ncbi:MAG: nucleotidyltransferase domain-containing protein [bacterium]
MAEKTVKPKVVNVIKYFAERLQESGVKVSKIVAFGSQLKGKADRNSDIDLIIVSESFRRKNLFKRAEMIGKAYEETVTEFMIPMDIIMESPEEYNPDFGVVVYAA